MNDDSSNKDNDLIIFREETKSISNNLFDIIKIPFEKTTEYNDKLLQLLALE